RGESILLETLAPCAGGIVADAGRISRAARVLEPVGRADTAAPLPRVRAGRAVGDHVREHRLQIESLDGRDLGREDQRPVLAAHLERIDADERVRWGLRTG